MRKSKDEAATPGLADLEAAHSPTPPVGIPPGARVRVDFETPVDTSSLVANDSRYPDDLANLAASELDDEDAPPLDPLTAFCTEWSQYAGYTLRVTRLADPAARRIAGQTYNRPCLEIESLGDTPFDPLNLQSTLQLVNGASGGCFRLWLLDEQGRPIPGAHLSRVAIGDPPRQFNPATPMQAPFYQQQPQPAKERELSDVEKRFQAMQEKLLENAMLRILQPDPPSTPPPQSTLTDEQKLTLMLAERGAILPGVVENLAKLASAGDNVGKAQTWTEWLQENGARLLETHPEIGERILHTASNLVALVVNRFPGSPAPLQQPGYMPPTPVGLRPQRLRAVPNPAAAPRAAITDLPEVPNPDDDDEDTQPPVDQDTELENATMIVLEDLIALLSGTEPLRPDHPVFARLNTEHRVVFQQAVAMIAQYPLEPIILWVKSKSPLYTSLLDSEVTGPHLRNRLQELKTLVTAPAPEQSTNATTQTTATTPSEQAPPVVKANKRTRKGPPSAS